MSDESKKENIINKLNKKNNYISNQEYLDNYSAHQSKIIQSYLQKIPLAGGNIANEVFLYNGIVYKDKLENQFANKALKELEKLNFKHAPNYLGQKQLNNINYDTYSFCYGEQISNFAQKWNEIDLDSALIILKDFHNLSAKSKMKEDKQCLIHQDLGSWNWLFENNQAKYIIDWDYLSPGDAIWDIAYFTWTWCLPNFKNMDKEIQLKRTQKIFEYYPNINSSDLHNTIIRRITEAIKWCDKRLNNKTLSQKEHNHALESKEWNIDCLDFINSIESEFKQIN